MLAGSLFSAFAAHPVCDFLDCGTGAVSADFFPASKAQKGIQLRSMKFMSLALLIAGGMSHAATICVNWQTNADKSETAGTILQYTRVKTTTNETCTKVATSSLKSGSRYCYRFTTPGQYTFRAATVGNDGQKSEWSNELTMRVD